MVEEYVRDLYRIGLILVIVPIVLTIIQLVFSIITNAQMSLEQSFIFQGLPLLVSGFLITGYISIKYRYKPGEEGETNIPAWPMILIAIMLIAIYLWWRLSLI